VSNSDAPESASIFADEARAETATIASVQPGEEREPTEDQEVERMEGEGGPPGPAEAPPDPSPEDAPGVPTDRTEEVEMVTVRAKFPLRMAVIGAPFSGKTAFQEAFVEIAGPYFDEHDSELRVFQNGGTEVEALGQAVGFFGGYREHLMAFFASLGNEMAALRDGASFLSNGTIFGNMAHAAANHEQIMLGLDQSGLVTPQSAQRMQQIQGTMMLLNSLMDSFRTQFVFRLTLPPAIEVPGQDIPVERRHAQRVDFVLDQILSGLGFNVTPLESISAEDRANEALATVKRLVEEGTQVPKRIIDQLGTADEPTDD
jgi:hypothetical protein